ncbi:MAG: elongation factor P-like protein YeiP [Methylococcaceae bacterium]|nr:elongation factor P-like protein YeiP [Methylococcaceae bacterium]
MYKASELKKGMVVEINDIPYIVKQIEAKSPSARGASTLYKIRFNNLKTRQKLDESFKSDDVLKEIDCARIRIQFSYIDGSQYVFMNTEDYSQYALDVDDLEEQLGFLTEGLDSLVGLLVDDNLIAIELPAAVDLVITQTDPSIKGQTAAGRTKTAMLSTGIEIQVPEYIESGELVKVNTLTGKFSSRA